MSTSADEIPSYSWHNRPVREEDHALATKIGSALIKWMDRAGLAITDLHKRTGVSRETIYRIRRGETLPSIDVLDRIAREIGTTPGTLADGVMPTEMTIVPLRVGERATTSGSDPQRRLAERVDALERDLLDATQAQQALLVAVQQLQAERSGARRRRGGE